MSRCLATAAVLSRSSESKFANLAQTIRLRKVLSFALVGFRLHEYVYVCRNLHEVALVGIFRSGPNLFISHDISTFWAFLILVRPRITQTSLECSSKHFNLFLVILDILWPWLRLSSLLNVFQCSWLKQNAGDSLGNIWTKQRKQET